MNLISSLLILLAASRLLGRLFKALGYLPIIGEILAGFLIGPAVFNFLEPTESLHAIVELGIFLLIFDAGLKVDLKDILSSLKGKALIWGLTAFIGSFSAGILIGTLLDLRFVTSIILGLCFSITSIPVALNFLNNVKLSNTPLGHTIMGTAVILEILSLLVLGISFDLQEDSSLVNFIQIIGTKGLFMLLFFFLVMTVNKILRSEFYHIQRTQKLFNQLINYIGDEAVFGMGVVFVLLFSTIAETLGFHFIIGAFFGGLLLNKDIIGTNFFDSLSHTLTSITSHFLTPIFFAYLGLLINLDAFQNGVLIASVLGVGYGAKIFSSWLGAKIIRFSMKDSLKSGVILNSRGTFDLIVADLALSKGYIDRNIFSILILFGVFSVLFNPIIYRRLSKEKPPPSSQIPESNL